MHYKNGREAKNGDKVVVLISMYQPPTMGILYDAVAGNNNCNGKLAQFSTSDPMPNLAECLHLDDVLKALANVPDSSADPAPAPALTAAQAQDACRVR